MRALRRRERPPAEALAALAPGERVLAWADTVDGAVVLATPRGVWWPGADALRLILWQHIDKATWSDGWLRVVEAVVLDDALLVERPAVATALEIPRDLPNTIRKRVEANIVKTELLTVPGGAVRFVARRQPGRDGIVWWARLEPGTRDTAQVRAAINARLALLRS